MLENFLLNSARTVRNGYTRLAREGYELVLSPDLRTVTSYSTVHRERTWAQVQAGVKSRFRGSPGRGPSGPVPERRASLVPQHVPTALNPDTAYLTGRVRTSFAKMHGLREVDDVELDLKIRTALSAARQGTVDLTRATPGVNVVSGDVRWLISDDAQSVIGVAWAAPKFTTAEGPSVQPSHNSG